jgi:two-component system CheB/CheR fusion protein
MDTQLFMQRLVEQSCDLAITFLDPSGRIIVWSGGAEYVFGYRGDEAEGQPAGILFVPKDREAGVDRHEQALAAAAGSAEDDRWMQRKDGSQFWANGVLTSIKDPSGGLLGFVKILRNRTDLKEQLEVSHARGQRLEESVRRKEVFLSTLSHELRAPLAPMSNALHILRTVVPRNDTGDQMLKVIDRQLLVLQRLVDDLLDTTRIEHGKIAVDLEVLPVRQVLEAAIEDTRELSRAKGHDLQLILPSGEMQIEADRKRIHQVFINLLTNAIKYTPAGGRIRVSATIEDEEAVTRIEDNGIGIGADMLPRIFELFTQVDSARELSGGGLGIGLALVRDLVSLHHGTVQVRSEGLGKGSEFVVRLPLAGAGS